MKDNNNKIKITTVLLSYEAKPSRHGGQYHFHIPKAYITNKLIDFNKTYKIYLEEKKEEP